MALTIQMLEDFFRDVQSRPPSEHITELSAHDYPDYDDDTFKGMVSTPGFRFVGGADGCKRFAARCERLGIKLT